MINLNSYVQHFNRVYLFQQLCLVTNNIFKYIKHMLFWWTRKKFENILPRGHKDEISSSRSKTLSYNLTVYAAKILRLITHTLHFTLTHVLLRWPDIYKSQNCLSSLEDPELFLLSKAFDSVMLLRANILDYMTRKVLALLISLHSAKHWDRLFVFF